MSAAELRESLYSLIDIINAYIDIIKLPDCNQCGNRQCGYEPKPGTHVRINCPHFKAWKGAKRMSMACTMDDWSFYRYKQENGAAVCEQYDSCEECPYYDEHHAEVVDNEE